MSIKCPKCNHEKNPDDAIYCQFCGIYLTNYCTNQNCENNNSDEIIPLDSEARYCPYCGELTVYSTEGIFDKD